MSHTAADFPLGTIAGFVNYNGYQGIILRGPVSFCAYIGFSKDHSFYGRDYDNEELQEIWVHGGFTYSRKGLPPLLKESADQFPIDFEAWYLGWDYAHVWDRLHYSVTEPEILARLNELNKSDHDWTVDEIENEIINVIDQIVEWEKK